MEVQALQLNLAEVEEPIRNRVAESGLIQLELSELIKIDCVELDFTNMLKEGMVVIENEFRAKVAELNEEDYAGKGVGLTVNPDAIIPDWAWMVVSSKLSKAEFVVVGGLENAKAEALRKGIENVDTDAYKDARIIVRGCDEACGPEGLLLFLNTVRPLAKSIMFGEACSTVPVFKKK